MTTKQSMLDRLSSLERSADDERWFPIVTGALLTIENAWSKNTRIAYHYGIRSWHDFAREMREPCSMPPRPEAVVGWLQWQVDKGYSRRTIGVHLSALAWASAWSTSDDAGQKKLVDHPLIAAWRRGHARTSRARTRSHSPPTLDEIRELVHACHVQRRRSGKKRSALISARDRALILVSYYGAMRKSEVSALVVGDVVVSDRGLELTFSRSKTDQTGEGEMRVLWPQDDAMMCPVDAWRRWLELYEPISPTQPAFGSIHPTGSVLTGRALSYHTIRKLFENRCKDAGIRRINPHMMRAAFATHASERHEEGEVAHHGRWRSRSSMDMYVRRGKTWRKNPTVGLGGKV